MTKSSGGELGVRGVRRSVRLRDKVVCWKANKWASVVESRSGVKGLRGS